MGVVQHAKGHSGVLNIFVCLFKILKTYLVVSQNLSLI